MQQYVMYYKHDIPFDAFNQEIDFLVINYSKQYILNIEVKTWLGPNKGVEKSSHKM